MPILIMCSAPFNVGTECCQCSLFIRRLRVLLVNNYISLNIVNRRPNNGYSSVFVLLRKK
jgi:hypothetical protein